MAEIQQSLTDRVVAFPGGEPIHTACFLGDQPLLVRDDGTITLGAPGATRMVAAHPDGAVLCHATTPTHLFTGGDDGRVASVDRDGTVATAADAAGKWVDAVAARHDGVLAWATGKTVHSRDAKGSVRSTSFPTTARGLAFTPKGYRLAVAHYNGASLWFPNSEATPDTFEWKGSHLAVTLSPDGRFMVTSMQEAALHGWRIADRTNMRMSGYPSRVRSFDWSADGQWLATSGADSCVLWPFKDKDGPMRKNPLECAVRKAKISKVAFHPASPLLAVGYEDGWVLMCRPADNAEILIRRPDVARDAITALAWNAAGDQLVFGTAAGDAGWLPITARA